MPKQHRARAPAAHLMPRPMNVQPFLRALLAPAELIADISVKYLGAAASESAQARITQDRERVRDRAFENPLGQMPDFDRRKGLDYEVRVESADALQQAQIPVALQRRMQTAD